MTVLLALSTVLAWGLWIPVAQIVPGVPQRSRTFYATLGNTVFAAIALVVGGGHLSFGWKPFWLPFAGGVVWTAGNYTAFRASENIGLARASGTWTPLNIITAFIWGALLFGELDGLSVPRFVVLGAGLIMVLAGVFFIVRSQDEAAHPPVAGEPAITATAPAAAAAPAALTVAAAIAAGRGASGAPTSVPLVPRPVTAVAFCSRAQRGCSGVATLYRHSGPRCRPRSATSRSRSELSWQGRRSS